MAIKGINRIILAVHDLEAAKAFYQELLGAEFHEANWTGEAFGIHVAISWNAGIELCAPMPGREADSFLAPMLKNRGEGTIINVVFGLTMPTSRMRAPKPWILRQSTQLTTRRKRSTRTWMDCSLDTKSIFSTQETGLVMASLLVNSRKNTNNK